MSSLNITVLDQSPAFIYTPDREGSSSSAWQSSWTGSPDSSYDSKHVQPNIAQGSSSHFTSLAGATVQIQFMGTAVFIYGQGTAGAYSTTLDGGQEVTGTPSGSALASYTDLSNTDKHTILLKVTVAQTLSLSYATFTIDSAVQPNAVVNQTQTAVTLGANNTPFTNAFFTTSGTGPFNNDHSDQNYTRLDTSASDSTFSFAFTNTSVVFVYGTSNYDHQTFSVELDPPVGVSQGARIFNATSKWFVLGNLIYWESGLDQSQKYQVKITNLNSGSYTDIHSVVMMTLPSAENTTSVSAFPTSSTKTPSNSATPSSKSLSGGAMTGIAVGAVAAFALVAIIAILFCRRRRSTRQRDQSGFSMNRMTITPYGTPNTPDAMLSNMSDTPSFGYNRPHDPFSASSASSSVLGLKALRAEGSNYSRVSTTDDFDPYSDSGPQHSARQASFPSPSAAPSFQQSGSRISAASAPSVQNSDVKGRMPSQPSGSRLRQEVDAGRIIDHDGEEVLPPNYDSTWAT